jgi:hypothetical protein
LAALKALLAMLLQVQTVLQAGAATATATAAAAAAAVESKVMVLSLKVALQALHASAQNSAECCLALLQVNACCHSGLWAACKVTGVGAAVTAAQAAKSLGTRSTALIT